MLGVLFLAGCVWWGASLLRVARVPLGAEERVVVAPVLGLAAGSGLLYVGAFVTGALSVWVLAGVLAVFVLTGLVGLRSPRPRTGWPAGWFLILAGVVGVTLLGLNLYGVLARTAAGGVAAIEHVWADAPFHASLVSSFAFRDDFPPTYPVALGEPLTYPFLVDFVSGALVRWGMGLQASFVVVNVAVQLALFCAVAVLTYRLVGSRRAAVLAVVVLFCLGNLGWLAVPGDVADAGGVLAWLRELPWSYTGDALGDPGRERLGTGVYLGNPVFIFLLPRRAAAFGLAVGAVILLLFLRLLERRTLGTAVVAGVLIGLLPRVHAHTAIVVAIFALTWCATLPARCGARGAAEWVEAWRRAAPTWLLTGGVAGVIAAPQLAGILPHADGFFAWWPGWTGEPNEAFSRAGETDGGARAGELLRAVGALGWFWLVNAGVLLLLVVPAWRRAGRELRLWYLPFVVVWVLGNMVRTQPWEWDNNNYFHYWQLGTVVLVAPYLAGLLERSRGAARNAFGAVLVVAIVFGGVLSLTFGVQQRHQLWTVEEAAFAADVRDATGEDAVVLTSNAHSHPVLALSGRQGFAGFTGWLLTHGIDWPPFEARLEAMYAGDVRLMREVGVTHVIVGPWEEGLARERDFELAADLEDPAFFSVLEDTTIDGRRWRLLELRAPDR